MPRVFALLLISLATACASVSAPVVDPALQPMQRLTVKHQGGEREFYVFVPSRIAAHNADERYPVVYHLHGYTSTATGYANYHGTNIHAEQHGYIAVYPQGTAATVSTVRGEEWLITGWNDGASNRTHPTAEPHCTAERLDYPCHPGCGYCRHCDWAACADDLGFFEKMFEQIENRFPVDRSRQYLVGVSHGGMMAYELACELTSRFAAISSVIGQRAPGFACAPRESIPMLHLSTTEDNTVRPDGDLGGDGFRYSSAAETASVWATGMNCQGGPHPWIPATHSDLAMRCEAYNNCAEISHEVVACQVAGVEHQWPGQRLGDDPAGCVTSEQAAYLPAAPACASNDESYDSRGMDLVWGFFKRYQRAD